MQGGVGAFSRILAGEMAAQGNNVFILTRTKTQNEDWRIDFSPVVQRWGMGSLISARRWAHEQQLDVVNIQYQTAAYSMSPFIHYLPDALKPIPVVTTFHDLRYPYLFPKAGRLRENIVARLARKSRGVIVTNHEDAAHLDQSHPCGTLIPIGSNIAPTGKVDAAVFRVQAGASPSDFLIVYFGLVNRSKGLDTLLEAVAQLSDLPVRLALIGAVAGSSDPTNTAYMSEIEALIERLGLSSRIHRTGYVDDTTVSGYLTAADVIALPFADGASYRRGTLMAAIQHGGAIVTTTSQAAISTFIDGENMRFVPPNDPTVLANALRQLYAVPDERAKLRQGARELAHRFEWGEIARKTIAFYHRVIGARR